MSGLEFALVIVGAVLFDLAFACVLAAALSGRRPSDRRAAREWDEFRAAAARQFPSQRKGVTR